MDPTAMRMAEITALRRVTIRLPRARGALGCGLPRGDSAEALSSRTGIAPEPQSRLLNNHCVEGEPEKQRLDVRQRMLVLHAQSSLTSGIQHLTSALFVN